ncbi:chromo domain-containing protein LHP1-like isoform X2 [Durio zibethinus]|uniref:Chromo domain-containing protein LHP1-like isoform X2 n=1 Tax=Durio zibethinus TaxID=66656 RepID=A0A6P5YQ84_DURZI|nr:chromo domain-containing protein LHP1-like isoform X2 [Durio zibethinus]
MKGGGRKRVVQSEEGGGGGEKEKKRGGSGGQTVESEGLRERKREEEGEEEEEEDEEDEEEGGEEEEGKEEENDYGKEEERTKLDDGFFEIEAIRRKRVRKGQLQYLIKWRGWPETSNTWEPLENLLSCSDVIDAFEESLSSGKHNRKRKRKYGGPHIQSKKKQLRSSIATYNATGLVVDKSSMVPFDISDIADLSAASPVTVPAHEGVSNGNVNNLKKPKRVKENGSTNGSKQIDERKDENDYDTKLSELKGAISSNGINADKLAMRFQGGKISEGDGLANGLPKVDQVESVQSDRRTGAKRRKSGSVKRFKQDLSSSGSNLTQNATSNIHVGNGITDAQIGIENLGLTANGLSHGPLIDNSVNVPVITKILKPVGFSASVSDNNQDVSVTFLAIRTNKKRKLLHLMNLATTFPTYAMILGSITI